MIARTNGTIVVSFINARCIVLVDSWHRTHPQKEHMLSGRWDKANAVLVNNCGNLQVIHK